MPTEHFDLASVLDALRGGLEALETNFGVLDDLNVFPVPDGDTGSNMLHTVRAGVTPALAAAPASLTELAAGLRERFKLAGRGNSGFLFATFHEGFLGALEGSERWDRAALGAAFQKGSYLATTSLLRPRDGTMLSVMAAVAEVFTHDAPTAIDALMEHLARVSFEAVRRTPDQLSLLRRAGVVDSGGLGFTAWIDGLSRGLTGQGALVLTREQWSFPPQDVPVDPEDEAKGHRYCTEIIVENPRRESTERLRAWLADHGSSIAVLEDASRIKVHVHLDEPQQLRVRTASFGAVVHEKIEDMHAQIVTRRGSDTREAAVMALVPGAGLGEAFLEFGAAKVLEYGVELPSPEELEAAIGEMNADAVLLLPNNGNIVPSAMQVEQQHPDRVFVLPTRTPIEGLCALSLYTPGLTISECLETMQGWEALSEELGLCRSSRDTLFGSVDLSTGTYFTIRNDTILSSGTDPFAVLCDGIRALDHDGRSLLTLYRGRNLAELDADDMAQYVSEEFDRLEVQHRDGGQRRYLMLVSLE
ncbi:DAK2 domain-containing protein [Paraliomyxa miuraensis]|uniref:DAK2 domain-containing protein n=1 Tax=Paraliomyxa miuraensis TaxID=376150 RepID=UPI002250E769|nr:DAK2 domain-containing protein [Paraliomyxa miuraensis]MCX4242995.1 DAK2 domain-containing protein [Paraliomyxa miuraensis]